MKKQSVVTTIIIILVLFASVTFFRGCATDINPDQITYEQSGTYSDEKSYANGEILSSDVTIENAVFSETLIIGASITDGTITLNHCEVGDELIINGASSIYLNGGTYKNVTLNNKNAKLILLGDTHITSLDVEKAASVTVNEDSLIQNLVIQKGAERSTVTTQNSGKINQIQIKAPSDIIFNTSSNSVTFGANSTGSTFVNNATIKKIQVESKMSLSLNANVDTLVFTASGEGSVVTMNNNAVINNLGLEKPVEIKGTGTITNATLPDISYLKGTITPKNLSVAGKPVVSDPNGGLMVTTTIARAVDPNSIGSQSSSSPGSYRNTASIINSDYDTPTPSATAPSVEPENDTRPVPIVPPEPETISVTGVKLSSTELVMTRGTSSVLTATVSPADATNKAVTWKTSDASVVVVDNGIVTPKGNGTATITVTTVDQSKTATCQITVKTKITAVTAINAKNTSDNSISESVDYGDSYTLPSTVTVKGYTQESFECPVNFSPANADTQKPGQTTYIGTLNLPSGYTNPDNIQAKIVLNVSPRPVITVTSTPAEEEVLINEKPSPLTVTASVTEGKTLSYAWYYKINESDALTLIPDETENSYSPPKSESIGNIYYYCILTADQAESVTTLAGTITTVNELSDKDGEPAAGGTSSGDTPDADALFEEETAASETPVIKTQPTDQMLTADAEELNLSIEVIASKGVLTYQWYLSSTDSNKGGTPIEDAIGSTLKLYAADITDITYYYAIVTNTEEGLTPTQTISQPACVTPAELNLSIMSITPETLARPKLRN